MFQYDDDLWKEIELRDYCLNFAQKVIWRFIYVARKEKNPI